MQEGAMLDALFKLGGARDNQYCLGSGSDRASGEGVGALYPIQIWVLPSVCLTDCLAMSVFLLLTLPPSQRILFSTTQMFGAVCCTALSCVYNKEVLVWRRREGSEVGGE